MHLKVEATNDGGGPGMDPADAGPGGGFPAQRAQPRDPVAQRIVSILETCASAKRPLTIMELVDATQLAKTTVHRLCWKLVELGMLEHEAAGFSVGTKLFALANANPIINEVRVAAMPYLVELQRLAGASNLAILVNGKALIIDGLFTREFGLVPFLGFAMPLHCTAVGKAIVAGLDHDLREQLLGPKLLPSATRQTITQPGLIRRHLDRVAEVGVAYSNEEFRPGAVGAAAGFKLGNGGTASIGCIGEWNNHAVLRSGPQVARAAAALERALA